MNVRNILFMQGTFHADFSSCATHTHTCFLYTRIPVRLVVSIFFFFLKILLQKYFYTPCVCVCICPCFCFYCYLGVRVIEDRMHPLFMLLQHIFCVSPSVILIITHIASKREPICLVHSFFFCIYSFLCGCRGSLLCKGNLKDGGS